MWILQQKASFLSHQTSALLLAPYVQSAPTPTLLITHFLAHWLIPFFLGFHKDQCLQLGEGAEAELQEEALSHQAPPRFECKWPARNCRQSFFRCLYREMYPNWVTPQLSLWVDRGSRIGCTDVGLQRGSLTCANTGCPLPTNNLSYYVAAASPASGPLHSAFFHYPGISLPTQSWALESLPALVLKPRTMPSHDLTRLTSCRIPTGVTYTGTGSEREGQHLCLPEMAMEEMDDTCVTDALSPNWECFFSWK